MIAVHRSRHWTRPEDYLARELRREVRHEYFAGEMAPMAGARLDHNRIVGELFAGQHELYGDTPSVIVEVMSSSTERIDPREKRWAYDLIPALHTYVLVAQDRREVTVHRRLGEDAWSPEQLPEDGEDPPYP